VLVAAVQPVDELRHGVHLIAAQLKVGCEIESVGDGRHA
jgi:hypothetical protein